MGRRGPAPGTGGRPRKPDAEVSHLAREPFTRPAAVLVTMQVQPDCPSLRRERTRAILFDALRAGSERFGFRLVQFSIQADHVLLVAEAADRSALTRGLQGLLIRVSKALNRAWGTQGRVFADRYEDHLLRTPAEARAALVFVLNHARARGAHIGREPDPISSGAWFNGWREGSPALEPDETTRPVARPRTKLLKEGWRRAPGGRIAPSEFAEPPRSLRQPERESVTRARPRR